MKNDDITTVTQLKEIFNKFCQTRNWQVLNTPKNLSISIGNEAAELQEFFTWVDGKENIAKALADNREHIENEVSDIAFSLLQFCNECGIDLTQAVKHKLLELEQRYPAATN